MVYELLVIGFATRSGSTPEVVKKKHGKLRPLARLALAAKEDEALRDVILAVADVRNAAAHETISDEELEERFVKVWLTVAGETRWPDSQPVRSAYCRGLFSLIGFRTRKMAGRFTPERPFLG